MRSFAASAAPGCTRAGNSIDSHRFLKRKPPASEEESMAQTNSDVAEISARAESWNMRLLGHSDLAGHGDGSRIDKKGDYVFVAHMKDVAVTILNVVDPRNPRVVHQLEKAPGVHSH